MKEEPRKTGEKIVEQPPRSHLGNNKLINPASRDYSRTTFLKPSVISFLVRVTSQVDKEEAVDVICLAFIESMTLSCMTFS